MIIVNNNKDDEELEELEEDEEEEFEEDEEELEDDDEEDKTRMDIEIEKNIKSFLNYGTTIEILTIVGTIIATFGCFAEDETEIGFIVLFCGIISALIVSMAIKWFCYTLHCLYEIKNNINK